MKTPRNLFSSIDAIARKNIGRDWGLYATLIDHWRDIVGEEYAETVTPVKISFPRAKESEGPYRSGGTLTLRVPQGLAMALTYKTGKIQERIASFFGYAPIAKITLETYYPDHKEKPAPHIPSAQEVASLNADLEDIEDETLRNTLKELGLSVLGTGK